MPNEKKHFLTAPRENVNSLTAQNIETKLAPTHQTNQFCCAQRNHTITPPEQVRESVSVHRSNVVTSFIPMPL